MLDEWFGQKAPKLPAGVKEFIVKVAPYLVILGIILSLPAILSFLGFRPMFYGYGYGMMYGRGIMYGGFMGGSLLAIFNIAMVVLYALAVPGLMKRLPAGWNYSFYAVLVCGVQNLLMLNVVGLIIGLAIGFYVLFQVKPFYFGGVTMMNPPKPNTPTQTQPETENFTK